MPRGAFRTQGRGFDHADGRVWVASEGGLRLIDADDSVQHLFAGQRVEAVLPRPGGRGWVAIRNHGLA